MVETKIIYKEIASKISDDIEQKNYVVHQKLPSEYELAARYDCSRLTIRKAIDLLQMQNLVVRRKNSGTYVLARDNKVHSGENGLVGFTEAGRQNGYQTRTKVIEFAELERYPQQVAESLMLTANEKVWFIKRVRYADDLPMTLESVYLRKTVVPRLTLKSVEHSLFDLIEKKVEIAYSHQEIDAVLVTDEIGKMLKEATGEPLFLVHTTSFSVDGYPILYDESYYRADQYTFRNILHRKRDEE